MLYSGGGGLGATQIYSVVFQVLSLANFELIHLGCRVILCHLNSALVIILLQYINFHDVNCVSTNTVINVVSI
jgi:hypothetical protein